MVPDCKPGIWDKRGSLRGWSAVVQEEFGVKFVYAWHSLHGYWAGVATGKVLPYNAQLVMPKPTPGQLPAPHK